jgi:MFS family permease
VRGDLVVLLCVTAGAGTVSIGAFPAIVPDLARTAGLADWELGLVAASFGLARLGADLPVGWLVASHLRVGLALAPPLLAGGVLLLASGGSWPILVAGRVLAGGAHALGMVAGLTTILRTQPVGRLAAALSAYEFAAMAGMLVATGILAFVSTALPWRVALLVACSPQVVGLLLVPAVLARLPAEPRPNTAPVVARRARAGPVTARVALAFAVGGVAATAYAMLEQFLIPLRAHREFGLDRAGIARLLMLVQLVDIACLLPVGVLADRLGARQVLACLLVLFGFGTASVAYGSFPLLVAGCVLFGLGLAGWTLPLSVLREGTLREHVAWRTALYRLAVDGGIFLGPLLGGVLAPHLAGPVPAVLAVLLPALGLALLRAR